MNLQFNRSISASADQNRDQNLSILIKLANKFGCSLVWQFKDAPNELQQISTHGGDEDYLALIPSKIENEWFHCFETDGFGNFINSYQTNLGKIKIGAHS